MKLHFYKYQGAGNDFILIDNRSMFFPSGNSAFVARLCNRRFGIGADGLMLLQNSEGYDFEMIYFNSDGRPGSMCGNGGRCITAFAHQLGLVRDRVRFVAADGAHEACVSEHEKVNEWTVKLKMRDVQLGDIERHDQFLFMNTGSPHYVSCMEKGVAEMPLVEEARKIRYNTRFSPEGTNVNFIEPEKNGVFIRTYERGVEDETLSCGTGSTAAALAASLLGLTNEDKCRVRTRGGVLTVYYQKNADRFFDIWLEGPAVFVFEGEIVAG